MSIPRRRLGLTMRSRASTMTFRLCAKTSAAGAKRRTRYMMISTAMNAKLNDQIGAEFAAAHAYLAMSCAFDRMALKVLAKRFLKQHDEEREHAMKILHYVQEVGGTVSLEAIAKPQKDYKNMEAIVSTALQNEKDITTKINDLM